MAPGGSRRKGVILTHLVHLGLEGAENLLHSADLVGLRFKGWRSVRAHAALGCPAAKQPAATIETSQTPISREHGSGQSLDPNGVVTPACAPARLPRILLLGPSGCVPTMVGNGCSGFFSQLARNVTSDGWKKPQLTKPIPRAAPSLPGRKKDGCYPEAHQQEAQGEHTRTRMMWQPQQHPHV
jgi:hypothetical protein